MNAGLNPNTSSFHPPRTKVDVRKSNLEGSLLQIMLDLVDMVALDHNVPGRPVDHNLLLGETQELS